MAPQAHERLSASPAFTGGAKHQSREASKPVIRISFAGTPATIALAGTSLVTTAPAPTIAPSPIVTPGTTVTPAPSQTLRPITTGAGDHVGPPVGVDPV